MICKASSHFPETEYTMWIENHAILEIEIEIAGEVVPVLFLAFFVFALVCEIDCWHGVVIKWFTGRMSRVRQRTC
jgi:hypothetical protein